MCKGNVETFMFLVFFTIKFMFIGICGSIFHAFLQLELRNLGETPLKLYPGQTIAQIFFHTVNDENVPNIPGQYSGTVDMIPQKISSVETEQRLRKLKDSFHNNS